MKYFFGIILFVAPLLFAGVTFGQECAVKTFCICKEVPDHHYVSYLGMWLEKRYYVNLVGIELASGKVTWEKPFPTGWNFYSDCMQEIEKNPSCAN